MANDTKTQRPDKNALTYIADMLRELRQLAAGEDLLVYLIEMAETEASDMARGSMKMPPIKQTSLVPQHQAG